MRSAGLPMFICVFLLVFSCYSTKYLASRTYHYESGESHERKQGTLLVFLPGIGSDIDDFNDSGLLRIIRSGGLRVDCVSVGATYNYYADRSLIERLGKDVFGKPELSGYRNYWFIGNSMGALGAILYARENPGRIRGIILLGPYLGDGKVPGQIEKAGGLLKWEYGSLPGGDYTADVWVYLKKCVTDHSGKYPGIVFMAGKTDRYHKFQDLLAEALPEDMVFWSEGGHDWNAWNSAFNDFIKSGRAEVLLVEGMEK
ncbi:MAG: hypothetical protein ABSG94_07170 [Brevinematales bacterium]|jgi:pimeloyl-ACP methyl ester carboxylesterase